jgi:Sulfotransferase domain
MLKCNLIIPGFGKSGTSSLHEYLALHPDICMSNPKETNFFSITANWQKGGEWYNSLFQDEGRPRPWYGESSVGYSVWEPALRRIKECLNRPRFIILLRHPVERLLSHYKWHWFLNIESRPLLRAVREEEEKGFHPDGPQLQGYVACYRMGSHYSYFCPLMERMFGSENILYLNTDELSTNPQGTLNRCFLFLNLKEHLIGQEIRENTTAGAGEHRTLGLDILLKPFPHSLRDRLDPGSRVRLRVRRMLGFKKRRPPTITASDIEELERMLKEDISFYEFLFGQTLKPSGANRDSRLTPADS